MTQSKAARGRRRRPAAGGSPDGRRQPPAGRFGSGYFARRLTTADRFTDLELRRRGQPLDDLIGLLAGLDGALFEVTEQLPGFVYSELARAAKTAKAAAVLAASGFGPQALVLGRTLFESFLYVRWAFGHPENVDDLVSLHTRWAATVEAEGWANSGIARFNSAPKPPLTEQERAEASNLFGKRGTRNWTGHRSIAELEKDVLLLETQNGVLTSSGRAIDESFTLMLGWADRMVHTTGISTSSSVSSAASSPGIGELIIGPSGDRVPQAVMLASTSYLLLLRLLLQHLDPSRREDLDAIAARMWRSSHDVEQLLTIEDDEPCPCDHPNGSWAQCHKSTDASADHSIERQALNAQRAARARWEPGQGQDTT